LPLKEFRQKKKCKSGDSQNPLKVQTKTLKK
jgi:hypothetical protein